MSVLAPVLGLITFLLQSSKRLLQALPCHVTDRRRRSRGVWRFVYGSVQDATNNELRDIQMLRLPNIDEAPLPEWVYHYTDTHGLLGILKTGKLWATDYRYLNDSSELLYTYRLAGQLARHMCSAEDHSPFAQRFLEEVAGAERPAVSARTPYYLCCFSESDNSLSQWRAYGGEQGYSLRFPGDLTRIPPRQLEVRQNPGITLLKVNYEQAFHHLYLTNLLRGLVDLCASPLMEYQVRHVGEQEALAGILPFWWGQQDRVCYRFKHPDFAVENEWRLVVWGDQHAEEFRAGTTITPYIELELFAYGKAQALGSAGRLPLSAVRHGPSDLPNETKLALDRLLSVRGYSEGTCARLGSATPARL